MLLVVVIGVLIDLMICGLIGVVIGAALAALLAALSVAVKYCVSRNHCLKAIKISQPYSKVKIVNVNALEG